MIFESDSFELVKLIKNVNTSMHEFDTIIEDIRYILARYPMIRVSQVFHEANQCADIFVKMDTRLLLFVFCGWTVFHICFFHY